jgi:DNA polymerase-3 subunit gamma/tau
VRDAYTLFDQVASFSAGYITFEKIRETLGLVGLDTMNQLFETCVVANTASALEQLDSLLQSGVSIEQFITDCSNYIRSLLLIKSGITRESLLGQSPERYSQQVLVQWNVAQLERALSLFLGLYRDIRYSTSPRYEVDLAISRLCGISSFISPQEVFQAMEQVKQLLGGATFPSKPQAALPVPQSQGIPQGRPTPFANGGAVPPEHRHLPSDFGGTMVSRPKPVIPPVVPQSVAVAGEKPVATPVKPAENSSPAAASQVPSSVPAESTIVIKSPPRGKVPGATFVPRDKLKDKLVEELSLGHASTASALLGSQSWQFVEHQVIISVGSSFALNQLQKDKALVTDLLQKFSGEPIEAEFQIKQVVREIQPEEVKSNQVDIICKVFKGTIVGGK